MLVSGGYCRVLQQTHPDQSYLPVITQYPGVKLVKLRCAVLMMLVPVKSSLPLAINARCLLVLGPA